MEVLIVAVVAAVLVLIALPFPIYSHGGMYPFEGVESADRADRDSGSHPRLDGRGDPHPGTGTGAAVNLPWFRRDHADHDEGK